MNGRVYDPKLGRFLSPDPFVQSPGRVAGFNRYAYVMNNPLKYTDPSGYIFQGPVEPEAPYWSPDGTKFSMPYQGIIPSGGYSVGTVDWLGSFETAFDDVTNQRGFSREIGLSFEDYYTTLKDNDGNDVLVHNSNFVEVSRTDVLALLEEGFVIATAGVVFGKSLIAFINPNTNTGKGWDAALVGDEDHSVYCYGSKDFSENSRLSWDDLLPVAVTGSLDIDATAGVGADIGPVGVGYIFRGNDRGESFKFNDASKFSAGYNLGAGVEGYIWYYTGDIENFGIHSFGGNRHELEGNYFIFGAGAIVGEPNPKDGGRIIGVKIEISTPGISGGYNYGTTTTY